MKQYKHFIAILAAAAFVASIWAGYAYSAAATGTAKVTFLSGKGFRGKAKAGPWTPIKQGAVVGAGTYVKADAGAKIELTLPDNSKLRIASNSVLFLSSAKLSKGVRNYDAQVVQGSVYTKATPSQKKDDKFVVRSPAAVAGIRGTAFNTILMPDGATEVKCYEGKVWVATWADYAQKFLREPQQIPTSGSLETHDVPGPEAISEEEWINLVGAMMTVTVGSNGQVSSPTAFDNQSNSEWEDWNRKRDAM